MRRMHHRPVHRPLVHRRRTRSLLALASLVTLSATALADQNPSPKALSLDQAIQDALAHDPTIQLAKLDLQTAQIDYQRSKATNLLTGTNASELKAESDLQSAKLTHQQNVNDAIITVIDQAFALQAAEANVKAAQDQLASKQQALQQVINQEAAGAAQKLDELSARADVNTAQGHLAQARDAQQEAQQRLTQSLGLLPDNATTITDLPSFQPYEPPRDALSRAQAASPDIVQKLAAVKLTRLDLDKAHAADEAPLDIQKAQNAVAIAKAQLAEAQNQLAITLDSDIAAVQQAADDYQAATLSLQLARQRHAIVEQQHQAGLTTNLDVLDDTIAREQSEAQRVTALKTYQEALLTLEALLGSDLRPQPPSSGR